jgi:hypothetical protein
MKIECREACFPPGFPLLCWFLDAGNDSGASHSGGRRPKSANLWPGAAIERLAAQLPRRREITDTTKTEHTRVRFGLWTGCWSG